MARKAEQRFGEQPWRRHLRATREGKAFIMVTVGVGIAAFNTGNNLLFLILGFMLSLIVLSGIMSETTIRGVRVSRRLPERAFAKATCLIEIELQNKKPRSPSYSLEVEDTAEGVATERRCYFLKIAPAGEQVAAYRRTPQQRGYLRLQGFRIATRYPFGIFEKWRMLDAPAELLVYPALKPELMNDINQDSRGAELAQQQIGSGSELAGLRGYQTGDDVRAIHWRRTAAWGRLTVMERHRDHSSELCIVLDNERPAVADSTWDAGFEDLISRAATLAVAELNHGLAVQVIARGSRSPLVQPGSPADPVLRYLALLDVVPAAPQVPFATWPRHVRVVELAVTAAASAGTPPATREAHA